MQPRSMQGMQVAPWPTMQSGVHLAHGLHTDGFGQYGADREENADTMFGQRSTIGVEPGDLDGLAERLKQKWDPDTAVSALKEAAERNGATRALEKQQKRPKTGDAAIDILEKVFEDGAKELNMQPGEGATVKLLKSGMRDFIDYALDEVERVGRMHTGKDGSGVHGFSWRLAGHPNDNPCLRRSVKLNHVSGKSKPSKESWRLEYIQRPVPPEVTPSSKVWPPPHLASMVKHKSWALVGHGESIPDAMSFEANHKARFSVV